ncbi:MAG TPA: bifunctional 4-hydroxy-2-oxoglutarate aldolase/2-dehydro-3-deoxy-phosphogluconate aldolase [Methylibium sp.]|uniref:bifunctional 4-hydroxy-2-oxoglutarate aldolase/2-dehydro-3-deoxy-phosphogluconate aldolase n=1 Tax=Methylibium sp. TaxID=2067992 RepID=UPI002DBD8CE2|nr:bifunctional 4-hydroxy-2-oxoglutarate aldolase/2-dehydro-3-deoxy-phosphogluconate aldolase [Methylibium sp.]HEU4459524.1 bifunctional 4-hydroxy-2-oxoglutarate aldolase/2-dehydro-3-deoxy-phosphogluconate aldolase [Methylibium sp.]
MNLDDILNAAPVIPVIVIDHLDDALPLAQALVRGGLPVLEVTLRTAAGLEAIRQMSAIAGAIVGAGTVLDARQYDAAIEAGARFVVSPGLTDALAAHAAKSPVPLLPGTATASEVMRAREAGFTRLKFFPAETAGGVAALKSFASVFRDLRFCPTGGITAASAPRYLAQGNVACVGGTWPMPAETIRERDWDRIELLARDAAALPRPARA